MLIQLIAFGVGLALIVWSANLLIKGAIGIAQRYRISELIIGMIIVGLGTSAPEFFVSMLATLHGSTEVALGNAIGSNIANIGLGLGLAALLLPIHIKRHILCKKFSMLGIAILAVWLLSMDWQLGLNDIYALLSTLGHTTQVQANFGLDTSDGWLLLLILFVLMYWMVRTADEYEDDGQGRHHEGWGHILIGMVILVGASELIVWSAIGIASRLGVSELLVGLTMTALGTSLPEIVTSLVGAWKKREDIAVGNILGSNLFNGLGVIGAIAIVGDAQMRSEILYRDFLTNTMITLLLLILFLAPQRYCLYRVKGIVILLFFFAYIGLLYQQEVSSVLG